MEDASSFVWWLVPSMGLAGVILGMVYVIREDPMFGKMLPFMDPSSAWTVAGYLRISEIQRKKDNDEPVSNEDNILWGLFGGLGGFMLLSKGGRSLFNRVRKFKPLDYAQTLKVWDEAARLKAGVDEETWNSDEHENERTRIRKNLKELIGEQSAKDALEARTNEVSRVTEALQKTQEARVDKTAAKTAQEEALEKELKSKYESEPGKDFLSAEAEKIPPPIE